MKTKISLSVLLISSLLTGCGDNTVNQFDPGFAPQAASVRNEATFFNANSPLIQAKLSRRSNSPRGNISSLDTAAPAFKNPVNLNFKYESKQWHLRKTGATEAWKYTQGNKNLIVAVIDTGVDYNHPDLKNNVIKGPNFAYGSNDPMDDDSHGTHVAGIIAANGNVKGIAPNVKILAIKVLPGDNKDLVNRSALSNAIVYAIKNGASIINLSLGKSSLSWYSVNQEALKEKDSAISEAVGMGINVVTASGNEAMGFVSTQPSVQENIFQIPVNATNEMDLLAGFSNTSNLDHPKTISAPGVKIFSTVPQKADCKENCPEPYGYKDGTSMAAPIVAGTLALIKSAIYDDYVRVEKKYFPSDTVYTFYEFFHSKQKAAQAQMGLTTTPSNMAEQIMFSYTNKENTHDPEEMNYESDRDPTFGYGRVDIGEAVKASSEIFTTFWSKKLEN
jgi:subtilisin family serine protease